MHIFSVACVVGSSHGTTEGRRPFSQCWSCKLLGERRSPAKNGRGTLFPHNLTIDHNSILELCSRLSIVVREVCMTTAILQDSIQKFYTSITKLRAPNLGLLTTRTDNKQTCFSVFQKKCIRSSR